ncbi:hypothetical protein Tco_0919492, partial [Tanacetum coccineum]
YLIRHPLHGKLKPVNKGEDLRPRTVNLAVGLDGASTSGKDFNDDGNIVYKNGKLA